MEQATKDVIPAIVEWGGMVAVMLLVIIGLAWLARYLIQRNTALSDRFADVVEKNTQAFIELREAIRDVNRRN